MKFSQNMFTCLHLFKNHKIALKASLTIDISSEKKGIFNAR